MIVKAATGASLFNGCYSFPQFSATLVNIAHTNGVLIFGYNRSYATNVAGELAVVDYVFNRGIVQFSSSECVCSFPDIDFESLQ